MGPAEPGGRGARDVCCVAARSHGRNFDGGGSPVQRLARSLAASKWSLEESGRSLAAAARSSQGLYLAAQSELVRPANPGLALILALEAADRHPGTLAHEAVLAAMDANFEMRTLIGHSAAVTCLQVSPDGRTAVTGSDDRTARIWDLDSGRLRVTLDHDAELVAVRFTPDSRRVVTFSKATHGPSSTGQPTVRVWDTSTGRRLAEWSDAIVRSGVLVELNVSAAMDLSRDGRRLVVTSGGFPMIHPESSTWTVGWRASS